MNSIRIYLDLEADHPAFNAEEFTEGLADVVQEEVKRLYGDKVQLDGFGYGPQDGTS